MKQQCIDLLGRLLYTLKLCNSKNDKCQQYIMYQGSVLFITTQETQLAYTLYVCIYAPIHIHLICTYIHIHTHTHMRMHTNTRIYNFTHTHTFTHTSRSFTFAQIRTHTHTHTCTHMHMQNKIIFGCFSCYPICNDTAYQKSQK